MPACATCTVRKIDDTLYQCAGIISKQDNLDAVIKSCNSVRKKKT